MARQPRKRRPGETLRQRSATTAPASSLLRYLDNPFVAEVVRQTYERLEEIGDVEQRFAALFTVGHFFAVRGQPARGQRVLERAVAQLPPRALPPLAELHLSAVRLLYAHLIFDRRKYTANQAELDHCLKLSDATGIHVLDILILAQGVHLALKAGDLPRARHLRNLAMARIDGDRAMDLAHLSLLKTAVAYASGDVTLAYEYGLECLGVSTANNYSYGGAQAQIWLAHASWRSSRANDAWTYVENVLTVAKRIASPGLEYTALLSRAHFQLEAGQAAAGIYTLGTALTFGRFHGQVSPAPWCDLEVMRSLCEHALRNTIEVDFVRNTIDHLNLQPRSREIESWPWAARIYTLGSMRIEARGGALAPLSTQQRRPIELLEVLIALGARNVRIDRLQRIIWQGGIQAARAAFDMAVMRLRQLLGHPETVIVEDGRASLNDDLVWVDALVLNSRIKNQVTECNPSLELWFALYRGDFLTEEGDQPWLLPMRDRLAANFRSVLRRAAMDFEAEGDWASAALIYERALRVDNLAEEFYFRLMLCLRTLGRTSEALSTYRRCRRMLSVVLNAKPARDTELLYQSLIQG